MTVLYRNQHDSNVPLISIQWPSFPSSRSTLITIVHWLLIFVALTTASRKIDRENVAKQGPVRLPRPVFDSIMAAMPSIVERAMDLLDSTMSAEIQAATGFDARQNGRSTELTNTFQHVQTLLGSTQQAKIISLTSFVQAKALGMIRTGFQLADDQMQEVVNMMPLMIDVTASDGKQSPAVGVVSTTGNGVLFSPLVCPYPSNIVCSHSVIYRTYDGRCNNLIYPLWGSANQPFIRFVPPRYADGIEAPRAARSGQPLPSARLVSSTVHWDFDRPSPVHTLMLMQMGQFIDHDMSRTAISKLTSGDVADFSELASMKDIECGKDGCSVDGPENRECLPIEIPRNDTDFAGKKPCLMFVRSMEAPNAECLPGPREQLNQITAYLDASLIYGSSDEEAASVRDENPVRGRLKVKEHPFNRRFKPLIPVDLTLKKCGDRSHQCFKAGDGRVNEFAGIITQHVIWMREHNRIEEILWRLNPHWSGERLFQETRKIIIAIWQYIIYAEYLPLVLGPQTMDIYKLTLVEDGFWNEYSDEVNAGIANSFATAAYRFGHSQLQGLLNSRDANYKIIRTTPLSSLLVKPDVMYEDPRLGMDALVRGLVGDSSQVRDPFVTKQATKHLFASDPVKAIGEDLMSLNIQRGRDHGLPGYTEFRRWCGLRRVTTFQDLAKEISHEVVERFERLYETVDDIDLWSAGIAETAVRGSLLGPTFTCILARQFTNLKYGDRFWFENNVQNPSPFTIDQLRSIRQVKYAKLLCNNADSITTIQPNVFYHPRSIIEQVIRETNDVATNANYGHLYSVEANERVPCHLIPDIDLNPWRELTGSDLPLEVSPASASVPGSPLPSPYRPRVRVGHKRRVKGQPKPANRGTADNDDVTNAVSTSWQPAAEPLED